MLTKEVLDYLYQDYATNWGTQMEYVSERIGELWRTIERKEVKPCLNQHVKSA